jgi:glycosyltransferase involved in cell wall biosynthesis
LLAAGIEGKRIHTVFPAVDLLRFAPRPAPSGDFTVLFASSPDRADWLEARGVLLILDAAAECPDIRFRMLWRPWGDSLSEVRRRVAARGLANVEIVCERAAKIEQHYQAAHVVVAPFVDGTRCKPMPNSILEGLACGRPAIVSSQTGIAPLIAENRAGLICELSSASFAACLRDVKDHWQSYSTRARQLAVEAFALPRFVADYRAIYRGL